MRHALAPLVLATFAALLARAGHHENSTIWITDVNLDVTASPPNYGDMNSCWSIQTPTGSSDSRGAELGCNRQSRRVAHFTFTT